MSMTRREWLTRVIGGAAALAVAPLIDMTDMTPAFWNQEPLKQFVKWRIAFPGGDIFTFDATVVAETMLPNGEVEFKIRPTGAINVISNLPEEKEQEDLEITEEKEQEDLEITESGPILPAEATIIHTGTGQAFELKEITLPEITRDRIEMADGQYMPGLQRTGMITLTCKWED